MCKRLSNTNKLSDGEEEIDLEDESIDMMEFNWWVASRIFMSPLFIQLKKLKIVSRSEYS